MLRLETASNNSEETNAENHKWDGKIYTEMNKKNWEDNIRKLIEEV